MLRSKVLLMLKNDDVVNAANDDDYGGNEEGTKNFGEHAFTKKV